MPKYSSKHEKTLWDNWLKNQDDNAANVLVQFYMYLVNYHVERIYYQLPSSVSKGDIKSFGLLGLFDALKKFDPSRELRFDTYGSFRIKGAILDGLRKEDWLPRSIRDKTKKLENISEYLYQSLNREPTSEEIAGEMGISADEVESLVKDTLFSNVLSIDEKYKQDGHDDELSYSIIDKNEIGPYDQLENLDVKKELTTGISQLKENEQLVISMFYQDDLTFTEIGNILELTTSRISQIHKKAIFKLRKTLTKLDT